MSEKREVFEGKHLHIVFGFQNLKRFLIRRSIKEETLQMRKVFVACLAVALLVTVGAVAQVDKIQERNNPPGSGNEYQVGQAAPGATQITQDFEGGVPPAGWSVTNDGTPGVEWMSNTAWGDPNKTSGSGESAACNTDTAGSGIYLDTSLVTESYDFCGATAAGMNVALYYENYASEDFLDIDVSTDGGANWTNVLSWNEDHYQEDASLDLSAYDGLPNVMLRFHYYDPITTGWDWDAQVDNFELTSDGTIVAGVGTCTGPGGDGGSVPATSTTGVIILAVLLMIGGSLFVVLRRRTA
jgi:hypothetical protein